MVGSAPSDLRRIHRGLALRRILVSGEVSRTSLATSLGLSQMAASRIARELIDAGLVEEAGFTTREAGPGRHATRLRLCDTGAYAAGIVLSAYSTEVAIVGAQGAIVARKAVELEQSNDGEAALATLSDALLDLIALHSIPRERLIGIGIALAANLDASRKRAVSASYLGLEPFDVVEPVESRTGLPATAENIVNALTLAETSIGVVKDCEDVVVVRCATTIGATILQKGLITRGHQHRAGRVGHLQHRPTKLTCTCDRNDCLNCSASGWSVLVRQGLAEGNVYNPRHAQIYARAIDRIVDDLHRNGPSDAKLSRALKAAGGALADALLAIDQMMDPEVILLAGSMPRIPDYMTGLEQQLGKFGSVGESTRNKVRIGEIRAVRAAAIMVLLEKVYSPNLDLAKLHDPPAVDDWMRAGAH